jgi:hypothetical protein
MWRKMRRRTDPHYPFPPSSGTHQGRLRIPLSPAHLPPPLPVPRAITDRRARRVGAPMRQTPPNPPHPPSPFSPPSSWTHPGRRRIPLCPAHLPPPLPIPRAITDRRARRVWRTDTKTRQTRQNCRPPCPRPPSGPIRASYPLPSVPRTSPRVSRSPAPSSTAALGESGAPTPKPAKPAKTAPPPDRLRLR